MSTKQNRASRRNAQLSTGPKTPEGKAKSSLNALKHGLTSAQVLAPSERQEEFDAHASSFRDHFAPIDPLESVLVEQIIVATWRLRRCRIIERFILEQQATDVQADLKKYKVHYTDPADYLALAFRKECDGKNALENLSRHETRIGRAFYRALQELDRQRSRRPPSISQNEPISPQVPQPVGPASCGTGSSEGPADGQPAAASFTKTRELVAAEPKPTPSCGAGFSEGPADGQPAAVAFTKTRERVAAEPIPIPPCGAGSQPAAVASAAVPCEGHKTPAKIPTRRRS